MLLLSMLLAIPAMSDEKTKPAISGWGWLTMGQVQSSEPDKNATVVNFDQQWLTDIQAGIKVTAPVTFRSTCHVHIMSSFFFPVVGIAMGSDNAEQLQKYFSISLLDLSIKTIWNTGLNDTVISEFGYFPVKYNAEAMNLGEYLFRSNAYPPLLVSGFEIADKSKLAGMHTGYRKQLPSGRLNADIFLNTETECYPTLDLSLSALLGYATIGSFLNMSMGISFYHLVPFYPNRVTPAKNRSYYPTMTSFTDSVSGVKTDYTFRGTKAVCAVTLDPKHFFGSTILGENDLKIYGELAILGIKNYPGWYSNRRERTPIMFGFNFPAFKLLDVLALEGEYFPSPYMNSYHFIWKANSPVPDFNTQTGMDYYSEWKAKHDDDWKWSVYASKTVKHVCFSGQIASDHSSRATYLLAGKRLYREMVPRTKDWYFMLRCAFFF
ncbi:MAG: hypothetical protein JW915_18320 [Chitinispirillaceae bacterium]|nr:hypothetical protein [Chitinispirillaceae bacterium]